MVVRLRGITIMERFYEVSIMVANNSESIKDGSELAKQVIESLGLKVHNVREVDSKRTLPQNNSIHKFCDLLAQELEEKHIDKREFFKEQFFISWTMEGVKNDIWKPLQKSLTGKKSTTELNRDKEITLIWDNINRIIIDKYKGQVQTPPFPSKNSIDESNY